MWPCRIKSPLAIAINAHSFTIKSSCAPVPSSSIRWKLGQILVTIFSIGPPHAVNFGITP